MHNEAKRLGIHSDVPPTGSQDHLNELLDGIHHLCDDIVLSGPDQLDSSSFHDAFEAMVSDCLKLLDPPDTIQDPESRKAFFTTVRKLVTHVMDVIKKHQHLQSRVRALAEINNGNINKITKHDDNLPRWSQFLGFNAPGAEKLQLEERGTCLQRQRRGYQVLPHAGIAILRNWDKEMTDMISAIDPDWEHGYWGPRFEWGSSSQHRLALGIRRFDALTVSPSPWAKFPRFENAEDMVHVNDERAEFEAIERLLGNMYFKDEGNYWSVTELFGRSTGGNVGSYATATSAYTSANESYVDHFDCVVIQRFIREEELEWLRERDTLSLEELKKLIEMRMTQQSVITTGPSAQPAASIQADPPVHPSQQTAHLGPAIHQAEPSTSENSKTLLFVVKPKDGADNVSSRDYVFLKLPEGGIVAIHRDHTGTVLGSIQARSSISKGPKTMALAQQPDGQLQFAPLNECVYMELPESGVALVHRDHLQAILETMQAGSFVPAKSFASEDPNSMVMALQPNSQLHFPTLGECVSMRMYDGYNAFFLRDHIPDIMAASRTGPSASQTPEDMVLALKPNGQRHCVVRRECFWMDLPEGGSAWIHHDDVEIVLGPNGELVRIPVPQQGAAIYPSAQPGYISNAGKPRI
ncbi:hypothetical protein SLS57_001258 [Botryosphaeria dothidea]